RGAERSPSAATLRLPRAPYRFNVQACLRGCLVELSHEGLAGLTIASEGQPFGAFGEACDPPGADCAACTLWAVSGHSPIALRLCRTQCPNQLRELDHEELENFSFKL